MAEITVEILYPLNGTYTDINTLKSNIIVQVNATGITGLTNVTTNVLVQTANNVYYNFTYVSQINTSSSLIYTIPFYWAPNNYTIIANAQLTADGLTLASANTVNQISIPQLIYSYLIQVHPLEFFLSLLGIILFLSFGFTNMIKRQPFTTKLFFRILMPSMFWIYTFFLLLNGMTAWDIFIEIVIMVLIVATNIVNMFKFKL
ncbi:MAG: hypothetical protein ACP5IB_06625 [Thermoplasmata archaeon]